MKEPKNWELALFYVLIPALGIVTATWAIVAGVPLLPEVPYNRYERESHCFFAFPIWFFWCAVASALWGAAYWAARWLGCQFFGNKV